ncbi:ssDNA-binding Zn-finger/Zn-ribbon topoisomerase 1 [Desulfobaculum xiamenense]|uniref:SsDNA-binding Zn-finger/Zn-ribbon topoisomerase 1 n=1 Tax=Desulfobaculum xiamenense TaxID=995050 RepID=A0A846QN73_9BACT|nr:multiheme c-type cytochrome [Desulfobaculum xiamenense]NJB67713.1 ssDNA-binding Zn-finger/Zn-ribbon topoisomerase 1 [Desulfobaculum xiamenense]
MKKRSVPAALGVALVVVAVTAVAALAQNYPKVREFRLERAMPAEAEACIECHRTEHPGLYADWARSRHASAGITCLDCHQADPVDKDVSQEHYRQYERSDTPWGRKEYKVPVAGVVTPKDCSRCHPDEVKQYSRSKHANTIEIIWKIDPWLNKGMNSDNERKTGCFYCHGTVLKMKDGKLDSATWPNVGVGRVNLDGSLGSCTSCHTRHRFSVMDARKPEACGQCHLGPDHPQIEIFTESKHGDIYAAFGHEYTWDSAPGTWTPGVDFRGPTCASCHMSGAGTVRTSHDVTERLSWETQAPLTVRPQDFKPFPARTDWKTERDKMAEVCGQCHGRKWIDDFYVDFDKAVEEYNEGYFKPAKAMLDQLYEKGLLDQKTFFDEKLEVEFYELWHHEGRRARMGAMMMAPDYAWWHGFYECKHRFNGFMEEANHLIKTGSKAYVYPTFPGTGGDTTRPPEIFGKQ